MIIIVLAPLLVLSSLALVGALLVPAWVGYLAVVFIGDIWMAGCLIRFRGLQEVTVVDLADSMAVYTSDAKAAKHGNSYRHNLMKHSDRSSAVAPNHALK